LKVMRGDVVYLKVPFQKSKHIQGGDRPYLVVSNDTGNEHSEICMVVPLTSANKKSLPTHWRVGYRSTTLCEQIFTVSQKDVLKVAGHYGANAMMGVHRALKVALELI